jgi:rhodanese-related sulfurtransferase
MPNDPFVDVGGLSSLGALRYLDVRDQASFDAAHAPGAVRVPLDEWDAAAKAADTGFAKTAYWDTALSALGLDPTVTAVAYDSGGMTNAARVWFILQYYGLNAVLLNGGWPALASATRLPPTIESTSWVSIALIGRSPIAGSTYLSSELRHWRAWSDDFHAFPCPAMYCLAATAKVPGSRAGCLVLRASIGSIPSRRSRRCTVALSRASESPTSG